MLECFIGNKPTLNNAIEVCCQILILLLVLILFLLLIQIGFQLVLLKHLDLSLLFNLLFDLTELALDLSVLRLQVLLALLELFLEILEVVFLRVPHITFGAHQLFR